MLLLTLVALCARPADGWEVRTIRLPPDARPAGVLLSNPGEPLAFSPDGRKLAVAVGPTASVWDIETGEAVTRLHLPRAGGTASRLAFTPDGKQVAVAGGRERVVRWYDLRTGKAVREQPWTRPDPRPGAPLQVQTFVPYASAFGPGAEWLLVTDYDEAGTVLRVLDAATGKPRADLRAVWPRDLCLTRDGNLLVSGGDPGDALQVWDVATGKRLRAFAVPTPDGRTGPPRLLGASHDGTLVAVDDGVYLNPAGGGSRGRIAVWSLADGRRCGTIDVAGGPDRVAFAADGRTVAVGSSAGTFAVIDLFTGAPVPGCRVPATGRFRLVTPDGKLLAALDLPDTEYARAAGGPALHLARFPTLPDPLPADGELSPAEVREWWPALGADNEFRRRYALRSWAARPEQAVREVTDRVRLEPPARRATIADLLTVLDDDRPDTRDKAFAELVPLAHRFEPLLKAAHAAAPPGEVRNRLTTVLDTVRDTPPPADLLIDLSAVEILEAVTTAEAKALLVKLAGGAADSRLTLAARSAVERLGKPTPAKPDR